MYLLLGCSVREKVQGRSMKRMASDLISELPDPLLCSIISHLSIKDAIATSVLSRRWRSLWKHLTRMNIDFGPSSEEIESVLFSQNNGFISTFRLVLGQGNPTFEELRGWIEYLKEDKKVEEVSLIGEQESTLVPIFTIPETRPINLFRGRSLRSVELTYLVIHDASAFEGCTNLETLKLDFVSVTDKVLAEIISNCISLENLTLIDCAYLRNLDIRDTRLKYLEVGNLGLTKFELRAESLRYLCLDNISCSHSIFECSHLNELRLYSTTRSLKKQSSRASDLLARLNGILGTIDNVQNDQTSSNPNFCNLRALHTCLDLNSLEDNIILRYCFKVWTKLEQLRITNQVETNTSPEHESISLPYPEDYFWYEHLSGGITQHLKVVDIKGFTGKEREMRLAIHLIKTAPKLDKILIQFDICCPKIKKEDAKRKLLSVPKASINASIVLNHEK